MPIDEQNSRETLGDTLDIFRPTTGNIVAGFIISILLLIGGVAAIGGPLHAAYLANWNLPMDVKTGWCWSAVGLFSVVGIFLTAMGVALAWYSRYLIAHRVELCQNGLRYCSYRSEEDIPWAEIRQIRKTVLYERPPILKGPAKFLLPWFASASYTVFVKSGKEYVFDGTSMRAIEQFGKLLQEQAERLSLQWETVEKDG